MDNSKPIRINALLPHEKLQDVFNNLKCLVNVEDVHGGGATVNIGVNLNLFVVDEKLAKDIASGKRSIMEFFK